LPLSIFFILAYMVFNLLYSIDSGGGWRNVFTFLSRTLRVERHLSTLISEQFRYGVLMDF
jgi:hypothetical protein